MSRAKRLVPKLRALADDPSVTPEERHSARLKLAEFLRKNPELEGSQNAARISRTKKKAPTPSLADQIFTLVQQGEELMHRGEELRYRLDDWIETLDEY